MGYGYETLLSSAVRLWIKDCIARKPSLRLEALEDLAQAQLDPAGTELLTLLAGATRMPAPAILEAIVEQVANAKPRPEHKARPALKQSGRSKPVRPASRFKTGQEKKAA